MLRQLHHYKFFIAIVQGEILELFSHEPALFASDRRRPRLQRSPAAACCHAGMRNPAKPGNGGQGIDADIVGKYGRHDWIRTSDLFRVKAATLIAFNDLQESEGHIGAS
jgi:hypothetical protein